MMRVRGLSAVACSALLVLGLTGCSDDETTVARDPGSAPADTAERAYADFATAVRDNDKSAFEAAVSDQFWSDLGEPELDDLNAAVENGSLTLPEEPTEVHVGLTEMLDGAVPADEQEKWLADWSKEIGLKGLTPDGMAGVIIKDGSDNSANDDPGESESGEDDNRDVHLVLARTDGDWVVVGIE
ncbi:hypothetical protein BJ980_002309 [Nocardioides daedukensis]|uniref:DUF4878 domain-containing protein n=1 Tax=Nocardioides daedukensis TaxID=634462 RepID=A0A7Y9S1C9_9ACTN|nr:hypothetical protein [Nocardioides daedukensis]NYG59386.1 hypothetical protein [Nocardioides daedukensis]